MEIDHLSPRDRIVLRLVKKGVPEEVLLTQFQYGLIAFVKENQISVPELVSAILPSDEDLLETLLKTKVPASAILPREENSELVSAILPSDDAPELVFAILPNEEDSELVSAILLSDEDFVENSLESKEGSGLKDEFHESMVWLQSLMFGGDPQIALENLPNGQSGVCGVVWGYNDIAYRCQTCQHDPTCALCVPCFQNGKHDGHDYFIIYTTNGCCDCGDVTALKREGFCSKHKGPEKVQSLSEEYANSVGPILDALLLCWKYKLSHAGATDRENARGDDIVAELRVVANEFTFVVVEMLLKFCNHSGSFLSFVSRKVCSLAGLMDMLVEAERYLSERVVEELHQLLLKFLGDPVFRYEFTKVFFTYYPTVVDEAVKEYGDAVLKKFPLLEKFSVQVVPTLTLCRVRELNLVAMLLGCLEGIFVSFAGEDGRVEVTKQWKIYKTTLLVLKHIREVMSHRDVLKYATVDQQDILRTWIRLLGFVQGMDCQKRETGLHVEEESENINMPFSLSHFIAKIHTLLVAEAFSATVAEERTDGNVPKSYRLNMDGGDYLRHAKVGRILQESSVCRATDRPGILHSSSKLPEMKSDTPRHLLIPPSATWLTSDCFRGIENWLQVDNPTETLLNTVSPTAGIISGGSDSPYSPEALNNCSVEEEPSTKPGALHLLSSVEWPDISYDVSTQIISVHLPLHRLLSLILNNALRQCYGESAMTKESCSNSASPFPETSSNFFGHILGGCHPHGFSAFVMEHPLRIKVFFAEVHAGMWRKNGVAPLISWEWYHSVHWPYQCSELDLFLLQCCAALAPADLFAIRIIERFGIPNYLSLNLEPSSEYEPVLVQEMLILLIQIIKERRFCGLSTAEILRKELVHQLATGDATHSQLVKYLPPNLAQSDQLQEILDSIAVYSDPSDLNQGMYSLRPSCWKELDLYHPRWNPRDLQVAEERYLHFCGVSAQATQLPRWTKIYQPLNGITNLATCKAVLQLVRAVLYYAVFTVSPSPSRAPDGVLLTALHFLWLALDICSLHRDFGCRSYNAEDPIPLLALAGENIGGIANDNFGEQSLLSLLVLLMRMHKKDTFGSLAEVDRFNISTFIGRLLKKFAEHEAECMKTLQKLAPELVDHSSHSVPTSDANISRSASDGDKRKAKARERQAAIMEKMKAQQSRYLASISSTADDEPSDSAIGRDLCKSDLDHPEECKENICSLCHDPNSEEPVSYLIFLQKSSLASSVDKVPPSWNSVPQSDGKQVLVATNKVIEQFQSSNTVSLSDSQLVHLVQNDVNELGRDEVSGGINYLLEYIRLRVPSVRTIQLPCTPSKKGNTAYSFETLEADMYFSIWEEVKNRIKHVNFFEDDTKYLSIGESSKTGDSEYNLLGKYIAAQSKDRTENLSASGEVHSHADTADRASESNFHQLVLHGFGPTDCDGIYLASCGHAVHQGCCDQYLNSLKERYSRRAFGAGHIVDPDQGEFLCPVCRRLANSTLPVLPRDIQTGRKQPMSTVGLSQMAGHLDKSNKENSFLYVRQALLLLKSTANMVERAKLLEALPIERNGELKPSLEPVLRKLRGMYFPGPARVIHSPMMWDTLKYSLMSTEIAARSGETLTNPSYSLDLLFKELKSSDECIFSVLIQIVEKLRSNDPNEVVLRFRGIQFFAESICSGHHFGESINNISGRGDNILNISKHDEIYPNVLFWEQASDPILSHNPFSSLMWVLFCLPGPFLACKESFISLVHVFYVVSVTQAIITYCAKFHQKISNSGFKDCMITDISNVMGENGVAHHYFHSSYIDPNCGINVLIRCLSFPYLRRCALLSKLLSTSVSAHILDLSSDGFDDVMDLISNNDLEVQLVEIKKLENMFFIPSVDVILKDKMLRSLVLKWFHHFSFKFGACNLERVLHSTPAVPFKLMHLPHIYQDLFHRYIKKSCPHCKASLSEPALCLLCGRLCSLKSCCRESECKAHTMACGAGIGIYLLIRKTTILLQRSARQSHWYSPYLDAYGEEDVYLRRGKPLYLNEERYAALCYMVASHGLDRSTKVLDRTTLGNVLVV